MQRYQLAVLVASVLFIGCGDDDSSGDGGSTACGVHFGPSAEVVGSVAILFSRPTGEMLGMEETAADGTASFAECVANTVVTFRFTSLAFNNSYVLQPGQTLGLGLRPAPLAHAPTTVSLVLSDDSVPPTATNFFGNVAGLSTGNTAGDPGDTISVTSDPSAVGRDSAVTLFSYGFEAPASPLGVGNTLVGFDYQTDVELVSGTTYSLDGWEAPGAMDLTVLNHTPDNQLRRSVLRLVDGALVWENQVNRTETGPSATDSILTLPGFTEELLVRARDNAGPMLFDDGRDVTGCEMAPTSEIELDLAVAPADLSPRLDARDGIAVVWTAPPSDETVMQLQLIAESRPWTVFAPASVGSFRFPDVPAELEEPALFDELKTFHLAFTWMDDAEFMADADFFNGFCDGVPYGERMGRTTRLRTF